MNRTKFLESLVWVKPGGDPHCLDFCDRWGFAHALINFHALSTPCRVFRPCRYFDLPASRLAPNVKGQLSPADIVWCMNAFVAVVYGLVVPLILLYLKEVHTRGEKFAPVLRISRLC